MNTPDQNRRLFSFEGKLYDVSEDEYVKNWHKDIQSNKKTLDSLDKKALEGSKPDIII